MTIRLGLTVVILLTLLKTNAIANDIYVHQVGDDLDMTIVQDGKDNEFTFCATPTSDTNCVDLQGNTSTASRGNSSDDSIVNVTMTGDENIVSTSHAAGTNNGNTRKTVISITGDENSVLSRLTNASSGGNWGGHKESDISITGDSNTVTHNSNSYGEAYGDIDVDGDDNSVNLYQRSLDTTATIDITNAGGPVTVDVQQLGSSYQDSTPLSTNVVQYCTNANGCSVTVTQN